MEVFNFMSQYIPNTEADRRAMLDAIGVPVFDETLILRTTEGLTALTPEEDTASA